MKRHLIRLSLLATLTWGSGCAYFQATPPLTPSENPEVMVTKDLPVPDGFAFDKGASHKMERDGFRRYDLVYRRESYLSEERVREFIAQAFPRAGWETVFIWGLEESHFLFHRGSDECEVRVFEDFGDRFTQFEVHVRPRETPDGTLVARKDLTPKPTPTPKALPASSARPKK